MVALSVWDGSCKLVTVTVTVVIVLTGEGALYEFVVVPAGVRARRRTDGGSGDVGVKLHDTPALVAPVTRAFRLAVCPSDRVLGWMLSVTITAP